jgi:hypothetical protein
MMNDATNRLLMSDSLRGMVPELEEDKIRDMSDAFLVGGMELIYDDMDEIDVLAGKIEGISFEALSTIKLDVRLELKKAYDTIKKYASTGLSCRMFYLYHGDDELIFEGPYKISSSKLLDFDFENKMCTLGVDLVKFDHI